MAKSHYCGFRGWGLDLADKGQGVVASELIPEPACHALAVGNDRSAIVIVN
jgi:hypothetical protein